MVELDKLDPLTREIRKGFYTQMMLLKALCELNLVGKTKETKIVIASACSTGTAILELGEKPQYFYSEMTMLARSFIEKITNYCYLQVCDEDEYRKFLLHPFYKAFHSGNRSKVAGEKTIGIKFSGQEGLKDDPKVKEALELFSETNPRMDWSSLNVDKKIKIISERSQISVEFFLLNTLSIYSNASESLHGTLYGCALPTGAFTPGINTQSAEEVQSNVLKNVALLYVQLGSMVEEVIKSIPSSIDGISQLLEASLQNTKGQVVLMKKIFTYEE